MLAVGDPAPPPACSFPRSDCCCCCWCSELRLHRLVPSPQREAAELRVALSIAQRGEEELAKKALACEHAVESLVSLGGSH